MGLHFGELYKGMRGIITYRLSPHEQKAFAGIFSKGIPNVFRRIKESAIPVGIPALWAYLVYDTVEKAHKKTLMKNPADYVDDK